MLHRISVKQVRLGMYVHAIEGSWLHHPFWRRQFAVARTADLERLIGSGVEFVTIDDAKGAGPEPTPPSEPVAEATPAADPAPLSDRAHAEAVIDRSKETMRRVFDDARLGVAVQSADVLAVVDEISGSVSRNALTLIGMVRLKSKDEYTYLHSVAVCALMVNLARQLDLPEAMVRDFGMAGLVHDIGKMEIPTDILNKPAALTPDEFDIVRAHPEQGDAMLARAPDIPAIARDVCLHHHEKVDGTGYPFGLKGEEISLAARMGAICDVYDALTSDRIYKQAWSPVEAATAMAEWTGQFDPDLLLAFFRSIGTFPVGMLMRLRTGLLAVTLPNGRRASRPRLRLVYDAVLKELIPPRDIVLGEQDRDLIVGEVSPAEWAIHDWPALRDHLTGEFDRLDPAKIDLLWHGDRIFIGETLAAPANRVSTWRPSEQLT